MKKKFIELNSELTDKMEKYTLSDFIKLDLSKFDKNNLDKELCSTYKSFGYCHNMINKKCTKSHSADKILIMELLNKDKKVQKQKIEKNLSVCATGETYTEKAYDILESNDLKKDEEIQNQVHNAGLDSFMTGYIMLNFINKFTKFKIKEKNHDKITLNNFMNIENLINNVYLTGKNYPLMIKKSNYSSISLNHQEKKNRIS